MDDLLSDFLAEATESLEVLDGELVKLEQTPNDPTLLGNIFRLLHTIKGTCGFLGLPRLEAVAHAGENILGKFRDGELEVTPEAVTLILESLDRIRTILEELNRSGREPAGDDGALIAKLNAMAEEAHAPPDAGSRPDGGTSGAPADGKSLFERIGGLSAVDAACDLFYEKVLADDRLNRFFTAANMDRLQAMQRDFLTMAFGGPSEYTGKDLRSAHAHLVEAGLSDEHFDAIAAHLASTLAELALPDDAVADILAIVESTRGDVLGRDPAGDARAAAAKESTTAGPGGENGGKRAEAPDPGTAPPAVAAQSIRVNVDILENLMTVVSELVLTRNQLLQILRHQANSEFMAPLQRLNQITTELQESVMMTRMQPIGNAWSKLPRIVRDLSHELGKKIDLHMTGSETELDRQILELIRDPLTHMVRNAADHGIEMPAERIEAGKPETGNVTLAARHEGGHIIVEISDDGHGIPIEKIKERAIANGLTSEAELEGMSDQQIQQFIFKPGFSTASAVTNVSGRGVGMDVVKSNLERIGGTIELKTTEGKGSRFTIKIPLTLAIISALIVACCDQRFVIPQSSVTELVRITDTSQHRIESINGAPVLRLRDRLLPLVSLQDLLKLERKAEGSGETNIVIAQVGTFTFGIIVDRVFDTEEIVVKPVAPILRHLSLFSGNTILGDGSIIMILDPNGIASSCGEVTASEGDMAKTQAAVQDTGERASLLLFRAGSGGLKAVPLSLIARLEEIDLGALEPVNDRSVVQYRGYLMPVIGMDGRPVAAGEGKRPVLVFTERNRSMGLMVDEIVDIVEQPLNLELGAKRPGVLGSAIVAGHAADILDTSHYLTQACDDWFAADTNRPFGEKRKHHILLVDDSPFFRHMLTPLLSSAGYSVTTAENAEAALELCSSGQYFDVIISDIEMPGKSGFEFASEIRRSERWRDVPLIALSSHDTARDMERGREVGFSEYVTKFDRNSLLSALSQTLGMRGAA